MKNNKGFSLLELVVVMALVVILSSITIMSFRAVSGANAKECAKKIEEQLNAVKTTTMGKNSVTMELYKTSDGVFADITTFSDVKAGGISSNITTVKLGKASVDVSYSMHSDGSMPVTLTDSKVKIEFDRASGAVKQNSGLSVCKIWTTNGTVKKTITLYQETGKITYE